MTEYSPVGTSLTSENSVFRQSRWAEFFMGKIGIRQKAEDTRSNIY